MVTTDATSLKLKERGRNHRPATFKEAALLAYASAHHMLGVLPQTELERLVPKLIERPYPKGHRCYCRGDRAAYVFIVRSGLVALTNQDERGNSYATITYAPGDVLGVGATVLEVPHEITPVAVVDTEAILIDCALFVDLYRRYPALSHAVVAELHGILRRAEKSTIFLARMRVPGRVSAILLNAAGLNCAANGTEVTVDLALSHQEIALLVGTTRETVTRIFARLTRASIIETHGRQVRLLQPERLRKLAELY